MWSIDAVITADPDHKATARSGAAGGVCCGRLAGQSARFHRDKPRSRVTHQPPIRGVSALDRGAVARARFSRVQPDQRGLRPARAITRSSGGASPGSSREGPNGTSGPAGARRRAVPGRGRTGRPGRRGRRGWRTAPGRSKFSITCRTSPGPETHWSVRSVGPPATPAPQAMARGHLVNSGADVAGKHRQYPHRYAPALTHRGRRGRPIPAGCPAGKGGRRCPRAGRRAWRSARARWRS
jgi:hypothetical protein